MSYSDDMQRKQMFKAGCVTQCCVCVGLWVRERERTQDLWDNFKQIQKED
jgi:hypothetical protein